MGFPEKIKQIRQRQLLTQEAFAKELNVAFSTVNRWEGGKAKPNLNAMKNIKAYCFENSLDYSDLEEAWLNYTVEVTKK